MYTEPIFQEKSCCRNKGEYSGQKFLFFPRPPNSRNLISSLFFAVFSVQERAGLGSSVPKQGYRKVRVAPKFQPKNAIKSKSIRKSQKIDKLLFFPWTGAYFFPVSPFFLEA
jgi:hypothetical protein